VRPRANSAAHRSFRERRSRPSDLYSTMGPALSLASFIPARAGAQIYSRIIHISRPRVVTPRPVRSSQIFLSAATHTIVIESASVPCSTARAFPCRPEEGRHLFDRRRRSPGAGIAPFRAIPNHGRWSWTRFRRCQTRCRVSKNPHPLPNPLQKELNLARRSIVQERPVFRTQPQRQHISAMLGDQSLFNLTQRANSGRLATILMGSGSFVAREVSNSRCESIP
jgi:hypothetical protein